ncbi:putative plasmid conjugal transfer protein [Burkholderia pseudomallei]|nr:putative plasmid conjugal transfer protein [Burkholderia pseudomallei]CAJ5785968.1 putative plasmid conjugal transfer protein [Burkholderia pseudomallei]VBG94417.1 putative plasmid conjugal transfer protein [Burkholderia pseudomallei]
MTADSNEKHGPKPCDGGASATHVSTQGAIASRNMITGRSDAPVPTFIDEIGPLDVIPLFITRTNARELLGRRPGETVAQALARMAKGS